jgi:hypothetical protein
MTSTECTQVRRWIATRSTTLCLHTRPAGCHCLSGQVRNGRTVGRPRCPNGPRAPRASPGRPCGLIRSRKSLLKPNPQSLKSSVPVFTERRDVLILALGIRLGCLSWKRQLRSAIAHRSVIPVACLNTREKWKGLSLANSTNVSSKILSARCART